MDIIAEPPSQLKRRATEAILAAIARRPALYGSYVMKGGLALHFGYGSPRRSHDVDLNAVDQVDRRITSQTDERLYDFRRLLNEALNDVREEFEFGILVTEPGTLSTELPTLMTEVRYRHGDQHEGIVKLQVTLSDEVCSAERRTLRGIPLHLASLEDILAEKLKALLQQTERDKIRSNDVFDVWYFVEVSPLVVDPTTITRYLLTKSRSAGEASAPRKSEFHRDSVIAYSASAYDELEDLLPEGLSLPAFGEAYDAVLRLVNCMDLPK